MADVLPFPKEKELAEEEGKSGSGGGGQCKPPVFQMDLQDMITFACFCIAVGVIAGLVMRSLFPSQYPVAKVLYVAQPQPLGYECQRVRRQKDRTVGEDCKVIYHIPTSKRGR